MFPLIKKFFLDETAFIRFLRAGIFVAGAMVKSGDISSVPTWVGIVLMGGSLLLGAGDKNPV